MSRRMVDASPLVFLGRVPLIQPVRLDTASDIGKIYSLRRSLNKTLGVSSAESARTES